MQKLSLALNVLSRGASFAAAIVLSLSYSAVVLAESLVIDGAKIVTGAGPTIDKGRIVIVGDKITAIGADAEIPSGATVIDGKGLTIYPGLIDAYCLAGVAAPPSATPPPAVAQGQGGRQRGGQGQGRGQGQNTPPPAPAPLVWRKATEGFKGTSEAIPALRANGYTAALFGVRGVLTPGEDVLMTLQGGDASAAVVRDLAAVNVNTLSRGFQSYPGTLMGAFAFLRQAFCDAVDYHNRAPQTKDRRLASLALASGGSIPTLVAASSENDIRRALRLGAEFKLKTIILGGRDAGKFALRLADAKATVILTDDWSQASALAKAGVPFALGSNKLEMSADEANDLRSKAIELVAKGMSEDAVLAALTRVPAEMLGASDRLGTLAVGRPAHLVVTEGGLFQKDGKVRFVVIAGKKIDAAPVKTAGGPKPKALDADGAAFVNVLEDDAEGDGE